MNRCDILLIVILQWIHQFRWVNGFETEENKRKKGSWWFKYLIWYEICNIFSTQQYMPLFLNYMPAQRCDKQDGEDFCYKVRYFN